MIERVLNTGSGLVAAKHFATPDIQHKMNELSIDWDDLMSLSANRRNQLDASLAKHKVRAVHRTFDDHIQCTAGVGKLFLLRAALKILLLSVCLFKLQFSTYENMN